MWQASRSYNPVPWLAPMSAGRIYSFPFSTSYNTTSVGADTLYSSPLYIPNPTGTTIVSLGMECISSGSAQTRLAIYEYAEDGLFGNLIVDSGAFTNTFIGHNFGAINQYIRQGWYNVVFCSQGNSFRWFSGFAPALIRGAQNPLDTATPNWIIRCVVGAGVVNDIITNGYPKRLSSNFANGFNDSSGGTLGLRYLVGT